MRWPIIAASLALACTLPAGIANAARGNQSSPSTAAHSSTTARSKSAAHKHKHSAKRQPPGQKVPTSDRITEIQSALARDGYYQGGPNGKFDSTTVAALQRFQAANGLDASGKLDAPTLQRLGLGSDVAGVSAPRPVVPGSAPATNPAAPIANCCSTPTVGQPAASSLTAAGPGATPSGPQPAH